MRYCCSNAVKKFNINSTLTVILIIAAWTRKSWLLKTWMAITSICAFSDLRSVLFDLMVRINTYLTTYSGFKWTSIITPLRFSDFSLPYLLTSLSKGLIIVGPKLLRPMPSNLGAYFLATVGVNYLKVNFRTALIFNLIYSRYLDFITAYHMIYKYPLLHSLFNVYTSARKLEKLQWSRFLELGSNKVI